MPFTVSHAAAAWPLRAALGERVVLSALVAGTLAPDLEYFLHMGPVRTIGHTLPGLFLMDVPAGLLLLWFFHRFAKRAFALLLPAPLAAALHRDANRPFAWGGPRRFAAICVSIWVGAATHLLWDAFTHRRSAEEHGWTGLTETAFRAFGMDVPVYSVLQNASSVLGLVALALWARPALAARAPGRLPPEDRIPPGAKAAAWGFVAAASASVGLVQAWEQRGGEWSRMVHDVSVHGVIGALGGALWASLAVAFAVARLYPQGGRASEGARPAPALEREAP